MQIGEKVCLGDGVYCHCDGYNIVLTINGADKTAIFLEPDVLNNLDQFRQKLAKQYSAPQYLPKGEK